MKPKGRHFAFAAGALALAVLGLAAWFSWPHLRFWWLFEPLELNPKGCAGWGAGELGTPLASSFSR